MTTGLSIFLFWLSGLIIFAFGYVYIKRVIDKDVFHDTLIYDIYNGCKYGIFSWFAIIYVLSAWITILLYNIDKWIGNKLNNK